MKIVNLKFYKLLNHDHILYFVFLFISVITFIESTSKFSTVKSPDTIKSPVISKVDMGGKVSFAVSAKEFLTMFVILFAPTNSV
jgi:hypothetical protein